jgi:hypothetical protein
LFTRFPDLTLTLSEGGIGWVPYVVERLDYVYKHTSRRRTDLGALPSESFYDHVVTCFVEDKFGVENLDSMNRSMICWESDYPHPDGTWPVSPEHSLNSFGGMSDTDIDRISHENALRIFQFDPFKHVARDEATVGALRGRAVGHDTTPREYPRLKVEVRGTAGELGARDI